MHLLLAMIPGFRALASVAILAIGVTIAPGCAMLGGSNPEPSFSTLAVVTRGQSDVDLEAHSTGKSALARGGVGAVGAGAVGVGVGVAAGAATGPLAPASIPFFAAVFGAIGAGAGATTGLIVGSLQGLPEEKAQEITRILGDLAEKRDFQGELRSLVEGSVPDSRLETSDRADAVATLELTKVDLDQHLGDGVTLHMEAEMTLKWGPGSSRHTKSWDYEFDTPERHVDEWLLDDGREFDAALAHGIDTIGGQMSSDLRSRGAR